MYYFVKRMKYGIKAIVIYLSESINSCFQFGTPWADGTASISQCAINPGETFNYRFKVDKVKTYSSSVFLFYFIFFLLSWIGSKV